VPADLDYFCVHGVSISAQSAREVLD
jgi:hypothetical protein